VAPGAGPTLPSRPPPEAQNAAREEAEGGGGRRRALPEEGEEGCRGGEREELSPEKGDEGCRGCTCSRRRQRPPRAVSALPSPDAVAREAGRGSLSAGRSRGQDTPLPPASRRRCRRWRLSEGAGVCDAGGRDVGGVAEASGGDVVRAPKPTDRAAKGGGHGGRPRLHATENSTPPWKPRAGGERVGEARDGGMGGASAGGWAGRGSVGAGALTRNGVGRREREKKVVAGGRCGVGEGDKKWKWARMVGMKERFKA
jgi:hypothetical protein